MISLTMAKNGSPVLVHPSHIATVMRWDGGDMVGETRHTPGSIVMTTINVTLIVVETVEEIERKVI